MNSTDAPATGPAFDPELEGTAAALQRICRAVTDALALCGAAVHLMAADADTGVAASSDAEARAVAELQFASNEGPAVVAYRTRRPVLVPELRLAADRWPGFCSLALERGVRALFAFPLQEGAVSFGVLELYADRPGPLDATGNAMAAAFARAATGLLLDGDTITSAGELDAGLATAFVDRARIHQAQGMVMVDLRVSLVEALTRMRARAFSSETTLLEVADQVIAGTLTADSWIDGDGSPPGSSA